MSKKVTGRRWEVGSKVKWLGSDWDGEKFVIPEEEHGVIVEERVTSTYPRGSAWYYRIQIPGDELGTFKYGKDLRKRK